MTLEKKSLETDQERPASAADASGPARGLPRRLLASTLVRHVLLAVLALIVLDRVSAYASPFRNSQIASTLIFACAAGGLTLLTGSSGQISLGQGAFMGIGAYCFALVLQDWQWPLVPVLIASTVFTAVAGVLAGAAAARLRGPYLAGATLALAVGLPSLATWSHLSGTLGG